MFRKTPLPEIRIVPEIGHINADIEEFFDARDEEFNMELEGQNGTAVDRTKRVTELEKKVEEITRVLGALVRAIETAEEVTGEAIMPTGTYYGIKFDE